MNTLVNNEEIVIHIYLHRVKPALSSIEIKPLN